MIVRRAVSEGIEAGQTVSLDSTAVVAKIRAPTDSGLLADVVRVGTRLLREAARYAHIEFRNHNRLARRRHLAAHHARRKVKRVPHYRKLIWAARKVRRYVSDALERLSDMRVPEPLVQRLVRFLETSARVVDQSRRRVIRGESVPSAEKVVSLHQPDVDIIIKDNRNTHFGHKVFAAAGMSGLVLDVMVRRGNPSDAATAVECVRRVQDTVERLPHEVTADGGYASRANLAKLKDAGVLKVCFAKGRGMTVAEMVGDKRSFRRLRNFRSRIEATFSWLKRSFGLGCCDWLGHQSFGAYCWAAAITHNLVVLARAGPDA